MLLTADGLRVAVRVSPRAQSDRLVAVAAIGGGKVLRAAVRAPPENGRANAALLQLLADACRVPRRDVSVVSGAAGRNKIVRVAGDPRRLFDRLAEVLAGLPPNGE